MSTLPRTQAAFVRGNQSTMDHNTSSQSALRFLFQEVSKLASPIHNSFLDTNPTSTWLNDTSRQGALMTKKEEEEDDTPPLQMSDGSCQHSLSHVSPYNRTKRVKEDSHGCKEGAFPQCNSSPWKVLSLINLQCDRLLQHSDVDEADPGSVSCTARADRSLEKAFTATGVERTSTPSFLITVTPMEDARGVQCSVKDYKLSGFVQTQTSDKTDSLRPELVGKNTAAFSQPQPEDKREDRVSVDAQSKWNPESEKNFVFSEKDTLNMHFFGKALLQTDVPISSLNTRSTVNSNGDASVAPSMPTLTLDHNANFALAKPESNKVTESKHGHAHAPIEETNLALKKRKCPIHDDVSNVSPRATSKPDPRPMSGDVSPPTKRRRTKTPRKQPHPRRSVSVHEPGFQGVTFRMDTQLDDSRDKCRLLITSKFSEELHKSVKSLKRPRLRTQRPQKALTTSSSEEDSDRTTSSASKGKVCASCCTRKTPMWRDAEDGTPLCNACGIRYKKYRVRCVNCWHIPRKESNSNCCCLKCGNYVRPTSAPRKHAA